MPESAKSRRSYSTIKKEFLIYVTFFPNLISSPEKSKRLEGFSCPSSMIKKCRKTCVTEFQGGLKNIQTTDFQFVSRK